MYKKIENCTDRTRVGAMVVGAMVDLQAWFVVQNSKNGSCDPDGGSNNQYGRSKCQEGSRSVNCDSLPVHCIALIVWLPQTWD